MKLAKKTIKYDEQIDDEQLKELKNNYIHLWNKLKTLEYSDDKQQLQVLYQEPDNIRNYEAAFFTLQIRHQNDIYHFDQFNIIVNNKSTFNDSKNEVVLEIAKFDTWEDLENKAMEVVQEWYQKTKK